MGISKKQLEAREQAFALSLKLKVSKDFKQWISRTAYHEQLDEDGENGVPVEHKTGETSCRYFSKWEVVGTWQVHRLFLHTTTWYNCGKKCKCEISEVVQNWWREDGERVVLARPVNTMCYYIDSWCKESSMKFCNLLHETSNQNWRNTLSGTTYEDIQLSESIKRLGFNPIDASYKTCHQSIEWLVLLFKDSLFETIVKQHNEYAYGYFKSSKSGELKAALKVALRHNIDLKDFNLFDDAVKDMVEFGYDIHNPKVLADFKKIHQRCIKKREERRKKQELEREEQRRMAEAKKNTEYQKKIAPYKDIILVAPSLKLQVFQTAEEFVTVGHDQEICVGCGAYTLKKDTLIFSAKDAEDKYLATIEYNQDKGEIIQCRGKFNSRPERYGEITKLLLKHKKDFKLNKRVKKQQLAVAV